MRRLLLFVGVFSMVVILFLPFILVRERGAPGSQDLAPENAPGLTIQVYNSQKQEQMEMGLEEYVEGVVAAEMPASFHTEALKAQALVARTYAVGRMKIFGGTGCGEKPAADICTDPTRGQAWSSPAELRSRWGLFGYYFYSKKIREAVRETEGLIITYRGSPIDAVYHSTSGGQTEAAEYVWGRAVPYLVSVPSPGEESSRRFTSTVEFTSTEMAARLGITSGEIQNLLRSGREIVSISRKSPTGRALEIQVGDKTYSGQEFRQKLNLDSTWIEVRTGGGKISITTRGFGHGAGMSQYGANAMATKGKDFRAIIAHYYPGTKINLIFRE